MLLSSRYAIAGLTFLGTDFLHRAVVDVATDLAFIMHYLRPQPDAAVREKVEAIWG